MSAATLAVNVALEAVPRAELPPNCEAITRLYNGDVEYMLARAPKNRALFLLGAGGAWRIDVAQLVATFADNLRAWDRQRELEAGIAWPKPLRLVKRPRGRKRV